MTRVQVAAKPGWTSSARSAATTHTNRPRIRRRSYCARARARKARLCFGGHATMENRNGLCVLFDVKPAVGAPESAVAVAQMGELQNRGFKPKSVGADKGYHTKDFVAAT